MRQTRLRPSGCICAAVLFCLIAVTQSATLAGVTEIEHVRFGLDVVPILTRLGCNGGGCHGKASGQNGFMLSLLGFEPEFDYRTLVLEDRGRRVFPADPDRSLILLKATASVPHGGGRLIDRSSDDYRLLRDWIAQGARPPAKDDPSIERIEVSPAESILGMNHTYNLKVTAYLTDGSKRDVTRRSVYQVNEPGVAAVESDGTLKTQSKPGLVAVMARYGDKIATFRGAVPFVSDTTEKRRIESELDGLESKVSKSMVNRLLFRQWKRLGIIPSPPADDATFLRRATIDICGTLPTPEEIAAFLADSSPDKREKLIQRLLDRPEYADYFAVKWADILRNRGGGYSTSRQRAGTTLFAGWIRDSLADNKPYDRFVAELLTATGSQAENPPTVWYRAVRKSTDYVESVAQAFLGVRIQCAQCHHHPSEAWSQSDYYGLAAVFARVGRKGGFADAEVPTDETIYLAERGEIRHPRTGEIELPRALGTGPFRIGPSDDPRIGLAGWMAEPSNPFFPRTMVNRMWAHFLGRGLIHPVDDARSTNPPTDPELLDALAADFAANGYDVKRLIRTIVTSHAYGLSSEPSAGNRGDSQTFARYYPRRMTAEVLLDGISQVLEVPTPFPGLPTGTRAIQLPDENVAAPFLDIFGRPARQTACECERVDAPSLNQALELVNSAEIQRKLTAPDGLATRLASGASSPEEIARTAFVRILGRPPRPDESKTAVAYLASEPDRGEACRSLLWSLIATSEFLFNH
ncbi:hypothetical protein FGO68_gene11364 [Halteria grandinella]|uniref:S-layer protein n=1 Tax=Halteria grandinella TaxID=5974 RepID=A0A8J8NBA2_HALGN|nr:hypothetical protein FGO68_gene11364 [Halteria grandinella]